MDRKKYAKRLLFPPVWVIILLTLLTAVAVPYVLITGQTATPLSIAIYVVAFYAVSVLTLFCIIVLPKRYKAIKQKLYANPFSNRYMTDRAYRTKISLNLSLGINLLHVGMHILSWYLYRSWWFIVLALYYVILSVMRFLLLRYVRRNELGDSVLSEWKRSRVCACILLLVNVSLSGAVLMILYQNRGFDYHGMLIYVMAAFTFYNTIHTIIDMVKYRKLGSPVMSTAKIISLSSALVSMLNLETAMFSQFGKDMAPEDQRIFIILTGAGVSIIVITLSTLLIVRATKEIRREKHGS